MTFRRPKCQGLIPSPSSSYLSSPFHERGPAPVGIRSRSRIFASTLQLQPSCPPRPSDHSPPPAPVSLPSSQQTLVVRYMAMPMAHVTNEQWGGGRRAASQEGHVMSAVAAANASGASLPPSLCGVCATWLPTDNVTFTCHTDQRDPIPIHKKWLCHLGSPSCSPTFSAFAVRNHLCTCIEINGYSLLQNYGVRD